MVVRNVLGALLLSCLLGAANPECQDLEELLGGESAKERAMQQAVAQEEFAYFSELYELEAKLKIAQLERAMIECQGVPNLQRLREVVQRINDLRLQMELADLHLQSQMRSILPMDKYKQWRAVFEPINVCQLALSEQERQGQAVASWIAALLERPCRQNSGDSYLRQLPQRSVERAVSR